MDVLIINIYVLIITPTNTANASKDSDKLLNILMTITAVMQHVTIINTLFVIVAVLSSSSLCIFLVLVDLSALTLINFRSNIKGTEKLA